MTPRPFLPTLAFLAMLAAVAGLVPFFAPAALAQSDTTPPTVQSATVVGATLTLTFSEPITSLTGDVPTPSAFSVQRVVPREGSQFNDITSITVTTVAFKAGDAASLELTLNPPVLQGKSNETIRVSYSFPNSAPLQDASGNRVAAFRDRTVTNNTPADTTAPTVRYAEVHGTTLTLTFSELLNTSSTPNKSRFAVAGTASATSVTAVAVSGNKVRLTVSPTVPASDTGITVSYTKGNEANPLEDRSGNDAANVTSQSVTNVTGVPAGLNIVVYPGNLVDEGTAASFTVAALTGLGRVPPAFTKALTVNLSVSETAGSDFVAAANEGDKTVEIPIGKTEAVFRVDTVNDGTDEPNGSVTVTVKPGPGYTLSATRSVSVPVHDDDAPSAPPDTTAPTVQSATVIGSTLTLTFTEPLKTTGAPDASRFSVAGTASATTVTAVVLEIGDAAVVDLTLSQAVAEGDTGITVSYAQGNDPNPLQDASGNLVTDFSRRQVTNRTDTTAPTVRTATVDGSTLTLTFTEPLDTAGRTPFAEIFTVAGTASATSVTAVAFKVGDPASVELTLSQAVAEGDTGITVSYHWSRGPLNSPPLQDLTGNLVADFSGRQVTNTVDATPPTVRTATVSGSTLTLTFTEPLFVNPRGLPFPEIFSVAGTASPTSVTAVAFKRGDTASVELTLSPAVAAGDTGITVGYHWLSSPVANSPPLEDDAGNQVADFSGQKVTNTFGPPTVRTATVDGSTLTLTFTKPLDTKSGTPFPEVFSVAGTDRPTTVTAVAFKVGDPASVELTLSPAVSGGDTGITVSYQWSSVLASISNPLEDSSPPLESLTGDHVADFSGRQVVNLTGRAGIPSFGNATVAALTLDPGVAMAPVTLPPAQGGDGALTYSLTSDPAGLAGLTFDPATRTLAGTPATVGRWIFTYRAEDADQNRRDTDAAILTFAVTVDDTPPRVQGAPVVTGDTLTLGFTERLHTGTVPPATAFAIRVGAAPGPVHPTAVALAGRTVTLTLATSIAHGATIEVRYTQPATSNRLRDPAGNAVTSFLRIVINATPAGQPVADAGPNLVVDPGATVTLDGAASADPDGAPLTFAWTQVAGAAAWLTGADTATPAFLAPDPDGPLAFRLTVTNPDGLRAVDTVTVTVRDAAPRFDEAPAALALGLTRPTDVVLPAAAGGNGALTYSLTSDPAGLAGLTFDPVTRTLAGTPATMGSWTFTYRAEDADQNRRDTDAAILTFAVTVDATTPARRRFLTRTLAVMGAQTLGSALDTLGDRFTDAGPASGLTVGGQPVTFGDAGARTTPSPQPCADGLACDRDETARRAPEAPSPSLGQLLSTSRFTLALGPDGPAGAGRPRWTLWGRGGTGAFAGEPEAGSHFKGQTQTGWLGLDARGGDWVAGLALSYDRTEADYGFDGGTSPRDRGDLETTLTTLYPYGRWALSETLDLQTILGAGRGTARHRLATGAPPEKSDLSLWLGSLGLRQQFPPVAGITLAARADASLVQLETDDGVQAIDGLSARSWRGRLGLDAARTVALKGGMALAPFVSLVGRYDGGDGFVGAGLEVAGGLRYTADRFELEARGRWLAVHAQDGAQERGLSVTARLSPDMNGEGLSLALAPRWGAATGDATALWQHDLRQSPGRPGPETAALDAQLGYGVALADGVLTPFAGTGLAEGQTRTYRVGTRWQMTGRRFTGLTLNLEGTRQESAGPQPVNQGVQLQVDWTF